MIKINHIHILEVISVLLFSLLANFIFTLEIDFKKSIDYIILTKLLLLSVSTFNFYILVDKIKKILVTATEEYNAETNKSDKASKPISSRYSQYYTKQQTQISLQIILSILFCILFFVLGALGKYLEI